MLTNAGEVPSKCARYFDPFTSALLLLIALSTSALLQDFLPMKVHMHVSQHRSSLPHVSEKLLSGDQRLEFTSFNFNYQSHMAGGQCMAYENALSPSHLSVYSIL